MDLGPLTIIKDKKFWSMQIEVFLLNYADESLIEYISESIFKAFEDLHVPKLKSLHNHLTNEDHFELLEG
jgi:exosome complex RNA-binding protein Rrp42 (RNase PH superfamily)